jgi:hypothetical protein
MLLLPRRNATLVENHILSSGGLTPARMAAFVSDNLSAAGLRTFRKQLRAVIDSLQSSTKAMPSSLTVYVV